MMFLNACSGGGPSFPAGTQCDIDYTPIVMSPNASQKAISTAPKINAATVMPPGIYSYERADVYYVQKTGTMPLQIQFRDSTQGIGQPTKQNIVCVRNFQQGINGVSVETDVVADILVDANLNQTVYTRHISFAINNSVYAFPASVLSTATATSVDQVYNGKGQTLLFMQNPNNEYELRTVIDTPEYTYWVAAYMTYAACPTTGCPAVQ